MKIIKSFSLIICLFVGVVTYAQSHNTTAGSACKYAKNRCTNMEGCPQCAACSSEDKKEKDAKSAEVKRRNDKIWADAKAKKDAEQKAYQDKINKEAADKKRKEEQALADKKASDELRKKYQEIANKGIVKTDVKGEASTVELKNIEGFEDNNRKVYGFKFEGKEVAFFPFIEDYSRINRIEKTNFFEVRVYKNGDNYSGTYKYSIIIDHLGNKIEIDGKNKFIKIEKDTKNNVISVYTSNSSPEFIEKVNCFGCHFDNFYYNRESAIASIKKQWGTLGFYTDFYIQNVTKYTLNYDLKSLKKETGWILSSGKTI